MIGGADAGPSPAVVSLIASGAMGAALVQWLVENGVEMRTGIEGRGSATRARTTAAGMRAADEAGLPDVEINLSVVPPRSVEALAARVAGAARRAAAAGRPPRAAQVDCNAVGPATVQRIAGIIGAGGLEFVDRSMIGLPPGPGKAGPALFVSGPAAGRVAGLAAAGIDLRQMARPVGAASALKVAYGGTTKGLIAVGAALIHGAGRRGVAAELHAEFARSQPARLRGGLAQHPDMIPKAARRVAEMKEIADFFGPDTPAGRAYLATAAFHAHLATGDGSGDVAALGGFFGEAAGKG